jgi:hypothetical protein
MLFAAILLKGLVEVALLVMVGQGILFIFAGAGRQENLIYRMFATVTQPIMKVARWVSPRFVVDQHIGFVAFFLLVVLWVLAVALKVHFFREATGAGQPVAPASTAR